MGFSCSKPEDEEKEIKLEIVADSERKCTDLLWLLFFIVGMFAFIGLGGIALANGDPWRVIYATDYEGTTCDINKRGRYAYYPRLSDDLGEALVANANANSVADLDPESISLFTLCMEECPAANTVVCKYNYGPNPMAADGEEMTGQLAIPSIDEIAEQCGDPVSKLANPICQDCWAVPLNSQGVLFRCIWQEATISSTEEVCVSPSSDIDPSSTDCVSKEVQTNTVVYKPAQENTVIESLSSIGGTLTKWVGDVDKTKYMTLGIGVIGAIVLGFVYLTMIQWFAPFLVWTTLWLTVLVSLVLTLFAFYSAGYFSVESIAAAASSIASLTNTTIDMSSTLELYNSSLSSFESRLPDSAVASGDETLYWTIGAWVGLIVTVILLVIVIALSKHVAKAIGVLQEASKAVKDMPLIVFYPIFTIFCSIVLIFWFIASSAAIKGMRTESEVNAGDSTNATSYTALVEDQSTTTLLFVNLFLFLWHVNFVAGIGMMTVAGAIGKWYFTRPPADGSAKDLPNSEISDAFIRTFKFHLGSVAFGSFIIAIIQTVRAIIEYIDRQTKQMQEGNAMAKFAMCFCKCCLWCFEKCIKYLSYNAYILVATRGKEFIPAACRAFGLVTANITTIGVLNIVTTMMLVIGKVLITMLCVLAGYQTIQNDTRYWPATATEGGGEYELSNRFVPLVMIGLASYTMARCFLGIYGMVIDTIMLCFCEDMDTYGKNAEDKYYMGSDLRHAMGFKGEPRAYDMEMTGKEDDAEGVDIDITGTS